MVAGCQECTFLRESQVESILIFCNLDLEFKQYLFHYTLLVKEFLIISPSWKRENKVSTSTWESNKVLKTCRTRYISMIHFKNAIGSYRGVHKIHTNWAYAKNGRYWIKQQEIQHKVSVIRFCRYNDSPLLPFLHLHSPLPFSLILLQWYTPSATVTSPTFCYLSVTWHYR